MKYLSLFFILLSVLSALGGQTIAEKKTSLQKRSTDLDPSTEAFLNKINDEITLKKEELRDLYTKAKLLHAQQANEEEYKALVKEINTIRSEIQVTNEEWHNTAVQSHKGDPYALWNQPDTTLEELVIDYGSQEAVFIISPEIADQKIHISSATPIPRASWSEMLNLILIQNGIGIRQLNPYLKELYLLNQSTSPVQLITTDPKDLLLVPPESRVAFILTPDPADVKRSYVFLDRFMNPNTTVMQQIGREILIVSQAQEVEYLLKLYQFIDANKAHQEYKLIPLSKIKATEMAKVISSMFDQFGEKSTIQIGDKETRSQQPTPNPIGITPKKGNGNGQKSSPADINGLKIIVLESLSQALFLVGTPEEVSRAESMIQRIEGQIGGGREKVMHWYVAKYSNANDLSSTLQEIYDAMITQLPMEKKPGEGDRSSSSQAQKDNRTLVNGEQRKELPQNVFRDTFYQDGEVAVNPNPIGPTDPKERNKKKTKEKFPNFIIDDKTGAIIMVVEKDILPRLLELLSKLDVPKKMVQIDVLLFEKRTRSETDNGLNLLRIGSHANNNRQTGIDWNNTHSSSSNIGIFEFFLSRVRGHGVPAYDLSYKFLLSQDNVHINANPSVVTINQTPAFISIVEEISISTGVAFLEVTNSVTPKEAFTRAQYGITLEITPTIHPAGYEDPMGETSNFITLATKVNFDTPDPKSPDPKRPNVTRREVKNEVLIGDGQTIILGGLRRKTSGDSKEAVPFLGEIPGFGKLFSINELSDDNTESFIF